MNGKAIIESTSKMGATFVAVNNYTAKSSGEVSNQTIVAGYSYEKAKAKDLAKVKAANVESLVATTGFDADMVTTVLGELEKSLTNPSKARSEAQKEAYTHVGNGLKVHDETGDLHFHGLVTRKEVLQKGEYKTVKSRPKTLCKKAVKKALEFRTDKIRQFKLENGTFKLRGMEV